MEDPNPKRIIFHLIRNLFVFAISVILILEWRVVSVFADLDFAASAIESSDVGSSNIENFDMCAVDLSKFLPQLYTNRSHMVCKPIWNTFVLRFLKGEDHVVTFVVSATYTTGWVGMGFSKNGMMAGSSAMVGWIDEENQATIRQYFLRDSRPSEVVPDSGELDLTRKPVVVLHDATIYMAFQVRFAHRLAQQSILFALGSNIPVDGRLAEHEDRTTILFDFNEGSISSRVDNNYPVTKKHGVFGIVGWGMFLPAGAIIARYFRHRNPQWYHLHTVIQSVGFVCGLASVVTGEALHVRQNMDIEAHRDIGYFILLLGFLQVLAFILRPSDDSKFRKYWNWYHTALGRTALFFGSLNIVLGIQIGSKDMVWKVGYGFLLTATLVTVVVLEVILQINKPRKTIPPAFQLDTSH